MQRDPKAGGGDHHQGVRAPRMIAARTSEDVLPLPGDPHLTTWRQNKRGRVRPRSLPPLRHRVSEMTDLAP